MRNKKGKSLVLKINMNEVFVHVFHNFQDTMKSNKLNELALNRHSKAEK